MIIRPLIAFFAPTPELVDIGAECLRIVAPSLTFSAVGVVLARAFDGAGNTVPAMFVNLLTLWGVEAALSYSLAQWTGMGITGVWVGRALSNLAVTAQPPVFRAPARKLVLSGAEGCSD